MTTTSPRGPSICRTLRATSAGLLPAFWSGGNESHRQLRFLISLLSVKSRDVFLRAGHTSHARPGQGLSSPASSGACPRASACLIRTLAPSVILETLPVPAGVTLRGKLPGRLAAQRAVRPHRV